MTTPYQGAPDGAVTVGGGKWNYGQTFTEDIGRAQFEFPMPNFTNMLDLLRLALERLPIEALQPWADFLGIVDGVFDSIGAAVDAIIGSLVDRVYQTVQDFTEWVTDFFQSMGSGLLTADLGDFGEWFDNTITQPIVGSIDGFIRGALGLIGSGFNVNIVEDTARDLAEAISSMNEIVTKLDQAASSGDFTGNARVVNFANQATNSTLGLDWSQSHSGSGSGTFGVSGGRAKWSGSASNRSSVARYTAELLTSDYQKVGAAFATIPSTNFFGGWNSYNYLYARMNTAADTYVYARFGSSSLQIGCVVAGSVTVFDTDNSFKFKPGSAYWLEAGTTGGLRIFRVWQNNKVIRTYTDASAISATGHLHAGMGVTTYSDSYKPAEVGSFAFYDNVPAVIKGCGWRFTRTNTATVDQNSGDNLFPSGYFNTPDSYTSDIVYTPSQNKVKVPYEGWYSVSIVQHGDSPVGIGSGGTQRAALYVNGSVVQYYNNQLWHSFSGYGGFAGTFQVYLQKDDEVQPGYHANWSPGDVFKADAGGLTTYWAGMYLGKQKGI